MIIKRIRYFVIHALFGMAIWFGAIGGHEQAGNLTFFVVWGTFATSMLIVIVSFLDATVLKDTLSDRSVPHWLDNSVDLVILLSLAWSGWFASAAAWAIRSMNISVARLKVAEIPPETSAATFPGSSELRDRHQEERSE